MQSPRKQIKLSFTLAKQRYADLGVDVGNALKQLAKIPISLHCWQGDDVGGFETGGSALGGGLVATGNYPGKARTPEELRADFEKALSLIPGKHRVNLHAMYGEFAGRRVDRDEISPEHFRNWIAWAKSNSLGLDFNPTCFAHPKAADGFTLSHRDKGIRQFWIEQYLVHAYLCENEHAQVLFGSHGMVQQHPADLRACFPTAALSGASFWIRLSSRGWARSN